MKQTNRLNSDFQNCLEELMVFGLMANPRGTVTREILNYNITLTDPRNRVITFKERKTNLRYLLGELLWYIRGCNEVGMITPYSKFWGNITNSGDIPGYPADTVNSNYGNRLFGHATIPALTDETTPINQWKETIDLLLRDKDTRQAIMNIHLPSDRHVGNKDVPCTLSLQWFIRENKLHLVVNMRSNDIILGFTNDVFQFTMMQEIMLMELRAAGYSDLDLGYYYHNAGSMHVYDRHFEMVDNILKSKPVEKTMIPMDVWNDEIKQSLLQIEEEFRASGFDPEFNFEAHPLFDNLSVYWQGVVLAFFKQDQAAFEFVHGVVEYEIVKVEDDE